jgi:hypothetical protein
VAGLSNYRLPEQQHIMQGRKQKMRQQYKVAKNPKDSKWYVVGNCGNGYWMPVSNPFTSKQDAERHISHQLKADSAARMELQAV